MEMWQQARPSAMEQIGQVMELIRAWITLSLDSNLSLEPILDWVEINQESVESEECPSFPYHNRQTPQWELLPVLLRNQVHRLRAIDRTLTTQ